MKNKKSGIILLVFAIILLSSLVSAYKYTDINGTTKIEANDYQGYSSEASIWNFSVTNLNLTDNLNWELPFYADFEGVRYYEATEILNNYIIGTFNGNYTISHDHNGTLENHSQENWTYVQASHIEFTPSKNVDNNAGQKGKRYKINATQTINIGKNETKYFTLIVKNILGMIHKFDIGSLDPLLDSTKFFIGNATYPWSDEINTTNKQLTVNGVGGAGNQWGNITLGQEIDADTSSLSRPVYETFENASIVQWVGDGCYLDTGANFASFVNGTYNLNRTQNTGDVPCARIAQAHSTNNESFNLSMRYAFSNSPSGWLVFGILNHSKTSGGFTDLIGGIVTGGGGECPSAADELCIITVGVSRITTGIKIKQNAINEFTIMYQRNGTIGQVDNRGNNATNITLFNSTTQGNSISVPLSIQHLNQIVMYGSTAGVYHYMDDVEIINGSSSTTGVTSFITTNMTGYISQFKYASNITDFTLNASHTTISNATNLYTPQYNISCNSRGSWSGNVSLNTQVTCPTRGTDVVIEVQQFGENGTTELSTATLNLNLSATLDEEPYVSEVKFNQSVYKEGDTINVTAGYTDGNSDAGALIFNFTINSVNQSNNLNHSGISSATLMNGTNATLSSDLWNVSDVINVTVYASDGFRRSNFTSINRAITIKTTINNTAPPNISITKSLNGTLTSNNISLTWSAPTDDDTEQSLTYNIIFDTNRNFSQISGTSQNIIFNNTARGIHNLTITTNDSLALTEQSTDTLFIFFATNISINESIFGRPRVNETTVSAESITSGDEGFDRYTSISTLNIDNNQTQNMTILYDIPKSRLSQWANRDNTLDRVMIGGSTKTLGSTVNVTDYNSTYVRITIGSSSGSSSLSSGTHTIDFSYQVAGSSSQQQQEAVPGGPGSSGGPSGIAAPGFLTATAGNVILQMTTEQKQTGFNEIFVSPGGERDRFFTVTNKGTDEGEVFISCQDIEAGTCSYVTFSKTNFMIKPNEEIVVGLNIQLPESIINNKRFNIVAIAKDSTGASSEPILMFANIIPSTFKASFIEFFKNLGNKHEVAFADKSITIINAIPVFIITAISALALGLGARLVPNVSGNIIALFSLIGMAGGFVITNILL